MIDFFKKAWKSLPQDRKYWAEYLFHFTEMKNAFKILKCGKLYSRSLAEKNNFMESDNASHEVIGQTNKKIFEYVRFYFRPLTPTLYNNEGLKLEGAEESHCPNPVFFLFDLHIIEQYKGQCLISEKTLSSELSIPTATTNINDIDKFNYEKIYHKGYFNRDINADIIQYRQAEFCVKDEVSLKYLRWIVTRSEAEKESLLYYLHEDNVYDYDNIIVCSKDNSFPQMFNKKRLYFSNVILAENFVTIKVENYVRGYIFEAEIMYDDAKKELLKENQSFTYNVSNEKYKNNYRIKIYVNKVRMYTGKYCKEKFDPIY